MSLSQWVSLRLVDSWITIILSLFISPISLVKQRSVVVVGGCEAVIRWVQWWFVGVYGWSGSWGALVVVKQ